MPRLLDSPDPVLIVGGGPTGLTLAIELLRFGVPCRVIDKRAAPATTSRSFTLHARTLEGFARAGYVERFLDRGLRAKNMVLHFDGVDEPERMDFTRLQSRFPYILIIEQDETESALREQLAELGGHVEWNTELRSLTTDNDELTTVLHRTHSDIAPVEEVVHPAWLVGCDGLHSTVRTALNLDFEGDQYTGQQMRMGDFPALGLPDDDNDIHYRIVRDHMLLTVRLPRDYRVLISEKQETPTSAPDAETARDEFQKVIDAHFDGQVNLGTPSWNTVFRLSRRRSTSYRQGRVFLCGDAAHIHSPAGGQGMNACIQDAFNLGYKLAAVAAGTAPESLLDTYEAERHPIAGQVITATDNLHRIMMNHGASTEDRRALTQAPDFMRRTVEQISGISYTYAEDAGAEDALAPQIGDRAPDIYLTPSLRLHDLLSHHRYTLLIFQQHVSAIAAEIEAAVAHYSDSLEIVVIAAPHIGGMAPAGAVLADTADSHHLYGEAHSDTVCLIRPDGHVGARCPAADTETLLSALKAVLL